MNIFTLLQTKQNFTESEKIVADYILDNPERFIHMTTKQISQECFVSVTSIYRLATKCGVSGLADLKVKLSQSLSEYQEIDGDFDFDFPIKKYQTHHQLIESLKEDYNQTVLETSHLFDLDTLQEVIKLMDHASQIDLYTSAGNIFFASNFRFQMLEIGKQVNVPVEEYHQRLLAAGSDSSHLAIVISFSGRGLLAQKIPRILHKNHVPIVLISSTDYHPEIHYFNYHLFLSSKENHYKKISSYSTRLSLLFILDVLYTAFFQRHYEENLKKKTDYYQKMIQGDKNEY